MRVPSSGRVMRGMTASSRRLVARAVTPLTRLARRRLDDPRRPRTSSMPPLKVATFNVNGIRSRVQPLLAWLAKEQPDIACLQELKAPDAAFPIDAVREAGYGAIWHGQPSWNGVAILARGAEPVERRRGLPGDPDDSHSRYLEADVFGLRVGCL